jgi:ATP adenylyltransferase
MAKKPAKKIARKKSSKKDQISLNGEIWPLERDVLFRPDRYRYVRKLIKPEGCVFCEAAAKDVSFESLCVHQTKHSMLVLNKYPYNSGHVLVIPKRHVADLIDLKSEEAADLHELLVMTVKALRQVYEPGGINLGLNLGAVAGAGIPDHIHYHVIPRWAGDLNFFPLVAETKTVIESLEMSFERLIAYFKGSTKKTK